MMAFKSEKDREAYVGKLRAAGFTPEEIDADVAEIEASKPAPVAPPASASPAAAAVAPPKSAPVASTSLQPGNATELVSKLAEAAQARSEQNQDLTGQVLGNQLSQAIKDLSGSDLGKVGLAVGAGYGLYKAGRLAERKFGPSGELDVARRVEPTMEPPRESARLPEAAQQPKLSATDQALLARSEANRLAKEQDAARRAATAVPEPIPEPPAFIRNQPPAVAPTTTPAPTVTAPAPTASYQAPNRVIPPSPYAAPSTAAPAGSAAPPVATTPVAPVAPAAPVVEAPVAQITAPVAEQPAPKPTVAETPKAAVPPATEPEKLTKEQKGMKNHLVAMYGGGAEGEAAYNKVKQILGTTPEFPKGQGGGLSPEQTKIIKDWRKVNIEGPKVNLTHDMKKALKGGAGLSVLMALPGFAEAAQQKDFGKMTDIATDLLVLPFAQSRELGEGEQYELAKRRYEGMVGGGRGIAPPSPRAQVGRR